jgi:hypothetical protein
MVWKVSGVAELEELGELIRRRQAMKSPRQRKNPRREGDP